MKFSSRVGIIQELLSFPIAWNKHAGTNTHFTMKQDHNNCQYQREPSLSFACQMRKTMRICYMGNWETACSLGESGTLKRPQKGNPVNLDYLSFWVHFFIFNIYLFTLIIRKAVLFYLRDIFDVFMMFLLFSMMRKASHRQSVLSQYQRPLLLC